jgi:hypothetical protein
MLTTTDRFLSAHVQSRRKGGPFFVREPADAVIRWCPYVASEGASDDRPHGDRRI